MTKKDYQIIAKALVKARLRADVTDGLNDGRNLGSKAIGLVVQELIVALEEDNARFDSDKFIDATIYWQGSAPEYK